VDFILDQLASGRRFRVFNVVDDFNRECVLHTIDFSIGRERLARELDQLAKSRPGAPIATTSSRIAHWASSHRQYLPVKLPDALNFPTSGLAQFNGYGQSSCQQMSVGRGVLQLLRSRYWRIGCSGPSVKQLSANRYATVIHCL
jgi:hypothetical protein